MMKWGTEIGSKLAKAFEALASGDVAGAFKALWGEIDFSKIFWAVFWGKNIDGSDDKPKLPTDDDQVDWGAGVQAWFDKGLEEHTASFNTWSSSTTAWMKQGLTDATTRWSNVFYAITGWLRTGLADSTFKWTQIFTTLWFWIHKGLTGESVSWGTIWTTITGWFTKGLTSVVINWSVLWQKMVHHFSMGIFGSNKGDIFDPDVTGAGGLHVTEPIIGLGQRTGKSYLMGEAGNETLIPDSQLGGGGGITINIENFSASQQELNKLRQTILSVVQEANTRRGRI